MRPHRLIPTAVLAAATALSACSHDQATSENAAPSEASSITSSPNSTDSTDAATKNTPNTTSTSTNNQLPEGIDATAPVERPLPPKQSDPGNNPQIVASSTGDTRCEIYTPEDGSSPTQLRCLTTDAPQTAELPDCTPGNTQQPMLSYREGNASLDCTTQGISPNGAHTLSPGQTWDYTSPTGDSFTFTETNGVITITTPHTPIGTIGPGVLNTN